MWWLEVAEEMEKKLMLLRLFGYAPWQILTAATTRRRTKVAIPVMLMYRVCLAPLTSVSVQKRFTNA